MKPFLPYTIVLYLFVFKLDNIFALEQQYRLSKQKAEDECSRTGRPLVNYKELQANPTAPEYLRQLEDGQMAWIDGYAELSPFFDWIGCFNLPDVDVNIDHEYQMIDTSLFLCLNQCLSHHTKYVGIKGKTCYCLERHWFFELQDVNHELCNISCSDNVINTCGGDSYIDLYRLDTFIKWGPHEPSKRQCIYLKKRQNEILAYTSSCHAPTVSGYVCSRTLTLENTCYKTFRTGPFQFCTKEANVARQEVSKGCMSRRERPMWEMRHLFYSNAWKELEDTTYWLSPYRTFGLLDNITSNETACLATIKVNNVLYLEPDDCSQKKHALCRQDRASSSISTSSQLASIATEESSYQLSSRSMDHISRVSLEAYLIGYIALSVSILGVLITVGFIFFVTRQLKWLKKRLSSPPDLHNAYCIGVGDRDSVTQNADETDGHSRVPGGLLTMNEGHQTVASLHLYEGLQDKRQQNIYEALG